MFVEQLNPTSETKFVTHASIVLNLHQYQWQSCLQIH